MELDEKIITQHKEKEWPGDIMLEWANEAAQLKACIDGHRRDRDNYEADNAALQERYDMMRQLIVNLRNDLDIPANETGLRYKVGVLIDDNAAFQKQVEGLRHHVRRLMNGYDPENLTMQSVYHEAKKALQGGE